MYLGLFTDLYLLIVLCKVPGYPAIFVLSPRGSGDVRTGENISMDGRFCYLFRVRDVLTSGGG